MTDSIKVFQVPAILEGVTPLKDGGMSLRFHTNEINKDKKVMLMEFYQSFGHLQFSDQTIYSVPSKPPVRDDGAMSPSARLRSRLFVFFKSKVSEDASGFEAWYGKELERIGNKYLDRLEG